MSYSLPGMQVYPLTVDSPSGYSDIPVASSNPITGTQHVGGNFAYSAGVDVPAFVMIFAGVSLGLFLFMHLGSTGRIRL